MLKGILRFALVWGLSMLLTPYLNRLLDQLATRALAEVSSAGRGAVGREHEMVQGNGHAVAEARDAGF